MALLAMWHGPARHLQHQQGPENPTSQESTCIHQKGSNESDNKPHSNRCNHGSSSNVAWAGSSSAASAGAREPNLTREHMNPSKRKPSNESDNKPHSNRCNHSSSSNVAWAGSSSAASAGAREPNLTREHMNPSKRKPSNEGKVTTNRIPIVAIIARQAMWHGPARHLQHQQGPENPTSQESA